MGKLVILSGPSCIGKGPLHAALRKFFPAIAGRLGKVVLHNTCGIPTARSTWRRS